MLRLARRFGADEFGSAMAKYVRPNHVPTPDSTYSTVEHCTEHRRAQCCHSTIYVCVRVCVCVCVIHRPKNSGKLKDLDDTDAGGTLS